MDTQLAVADLSKKKKSKTKQNLLGTSLEEDSGFSTDEFSEEYETREPRSVLLPKKTIGRALSRGMTNTSIVTSLNVSRIDVDKAQEAFENHQKQKQEIMDVCEKRTQEFSKLIK